jgi:hypothetical protein
LVDGVGIEGIKRRRLCLRRWIGNGCVLISPYRKFTRAEWSKAGISINSKSPELDLFF